MPPFSNTIFCAIIVSVYGESSDVIPVLVGEVDILPLIGYDAISIVYNLFQFSSYLHLGQIVPLLLELLKVCPQISQTPVNLQSPQFLLYNNNCYRKILHNQYNANSH